MFRIVCIVTAACISLVACQEDKKTGDTNEDSKQGEHVMAITVSSPAFSAEGMIPLKYTCDGEDISPPLMFDGVPEKAKSLVLIADDPDAPMGTWVHWVLYNLPPDIGELKENIPSDEELESGARHGLTDFGRYGYGGPCPPSGTHRYYFKMYALDIILDISGKVAKEDVLTAMDGHVIAEGQIMGKYKRQ